MTDIFDLKLWGLWEGSASLICILHNENTNDLEAAVSEMSPHGELFQIKVAAQGQAHLPRK